MKPIHAVIAAVALLAFAAPAAAATRSPVDAQLSWALAEMNGHGGSLSVAEVQRHFAPSFLAKLPPQVVVQALRGTIALGPLQPRGYAGKATATSAILRVTSPKHQALAVYATVERRAPHRLTGFEVTDPPGASARELATEGRYTGAFPVGNGRRLFITCAGSGPVTVILEAGAGGGASAWTAVQPKVAERTRVCSYDRANLPGGSSDPAPKPQTAADIVRDLHRALAAAGVPAPYIFAGHSNGGLYARLYATTYPEDVRGLILVDSVSEETPARERALFKKLMTPSQWRGYLASLNRRPPFVEYVGDEQVDLEASYREMRDAARRHPLHDVRLVVISHGVADPMPREQLKGLRAGMERTWQSMQRDLARLAPGGTRIVARTSHHQIPTEAPALVAETIIQMVAQMRR